MERATGARLDGDDVLIEQDGAAANSVRSRHGANIDNRLPTGNLTLDDPIKRATIQNFFDALRHHAGNMHLLVGQFTRAAGGGILGNPTGEIGNGFATDAEFDEM